MKFKIEVKETRNYFHTLVFDAEATREEVKAALKDIEADKANISLQDIICDLEHYGATNIAKEVDTEGCCDLFQTTNFSELKAKKAAQEVPVQEQFVGQCSNCGHTNIIEVLPKHIEPKFCTQCGSKVTYQSVP